MADTDQNVTKGEPIIEMEQRTQELTTAHNEVNKEESEDKVEEKRDDVVDNVDKTEGAVENAEEQSDDDDGDYFTTYDGRKLFTRYWKNAESPPKALVFIAHGYSEHCGYYAEVAGLLVNEGCYVIAHDHIGHGKSDGDPCHVDDFNIFVTDVLEHIDAFRTQFPPELKVFIVGHSMGGAISILAANQRPELFSGVVLIGAPFVSMAGRFGKFILRITAALFPQYLIVKMTEEIREKYRATHDDAKLQYFYNDPLVFHDGFKAKMYLCISRAIEEIQAKTTTVEWPFFISHGAEDNLCPVKGAHIFYDSAKSVDKKIKVYEGCYHSVHTEIEPHGSKVRDDIRAWIVERM